MTELPPPPASTESTRPPLRPAAERAAPDATFWGDDRRRALPRPAMGTGFDALRDRFDEWRADARFGVVALVVIAIVAGVVWYKIGVSGGSETSASRSTERTSSTQSPRNEPVSTTSARDTVVVHVAGAVTRPGVAELPAGSRVIDAVEAAGGALPDADLDQLNLAAKVADGERVVVPRAGEIAVTGDVPEGDPGSVTTPGLLNLNTATSDQLEELPGIGPVLAQAILDERDRRGGFRSVNELREVRGIGEKRFADLRDRVTV